MICGADHCTNTIVGGKVCQVIVTEEAGTALSSGNPDHPVSRYTTYARVLCGVCTDGLFNVVGSVLP